MTMSDPVEFLLARIADDEAAAKAVLEEHEMVGWESFVESAGMYDGAASQFASMFTPARVLAECESKRRIVERCAPLADEQVRRQTRTLALDALLAIALPYSDHPDYRAEWDA